jgi:AAA+ superfamily predicted ATPase
MSNTMDTPSTVFLSELNAVGVADNYEAIRGQESRKSHGFQRAVDCRVGVGWVEGYYIILS